jgi:hypothetical protein
MILNWRDLAHNEAPEIHASFYDVMMASVREVNYLEVARNFRVNIQPAPQSRGAGIKITLKMGVGGGSPQITSIIFFYLYRVGGPIGHKHITATICRIDI